MRQAYDYWQDQPGISPHEQQVPSKPKDVRRSPQAKGSNGTQGHQQHRSRSRTKHKQLLQFSSTRATRQLTTLPSANLNTVGKRALITREEKPTKAQQIHSRRTDRTQATADRQAIPGRQKAPVHAARKKATPAGNPEEKKLHKVSSPPAPPPTDCKSQAGSKGRRREENPKLSSASSPAQRRKNSEFHSPQPTAAASNPEEKKTQSSQTPPASYYASACSTREKKLKVPLSSSYTTQHSTTSSSKGRRREENPEFSDSPSYTSAHRVALTATQAQRREKATASQAGSKEPRSEKLQSSFFFPSPATPASTTLRHLQASKHDGEELRGEKLFKKFFSLPQATLHHRHPLPKQHSQPSTSTTPLRDEKTTLLHFTLTFSPLTWVRTPKNL